MPSHRSGLNGVIIAVPESRQLDIMAKLLEKRGASVYRVPLVAIHDAPDSGPVLEWIRRFIVAPPDVFVIFTGEGVRRLLALAESQQLQEALLAAWSGTTLVCRGPKPVRALREAGLKSVIPAKAPTTDGVIETLAGMAIHGQRVAVQLYGDDPNVKLMEYLQSEQAAVDQVAPYVYADDSEESRVLDLLDMLGRQELDAIAFTSQLQYRRLRQVARKHDLEDVLQQGLANCCVAAVGPVVAEQLRENGVHVDLMPGQAFFMKPLVTELMRFFSSPTTDHATE